VIASAGTSAMLLKSHLGRKRSRVQLQQDKQAKEDEEYELIENRKKVKQLEIDLHL
jgi:hypothetical protein